MTETFLIITLLSVALLAALAFVPALRHRAEKVVKGGFYLLALLAIVAGTLVKSVFTTAGRRLAH